MAIIDVSRRVALVAVHLVTAFVTVITHRHAPAAELLDDDSRRVHREIPLS